MFVFISLLGCKQLSNLPDMSIIYRLVYNVSTIVQLYRGGQLYLWMKPKYLEKTTDLSQVNDKLHHIILHRVHLAIDGV